MRPDSVQYAVLVENFVVIIDKWGTLNRTIYRKQAEFKRKALSGDRIFFDLPPGYAIIYNSAVRLA